MAASESFVIRASLAPKIYRDLEIAATSTLYALAEAIVGSFDFDFDHAFGFYSGLKGNILASPIRYELFADIGEGGDGALSVKRTRVGDAFPSVGKKMSFVFDYGDEWVFQVELIQRRPKESKAKLPRLLGSAGEAPEQYPDPEDE